MSVCGSFQAKIICKNSKTKAVFFVSFTNTLTNLLYGSTGQQLKPMHFYLRRNPKIIEDKFPVLFNDTMGHIKNTKINLRSDNSVTLVAQNYQQKYRERAGKIGEPRNH